MRWKILLVAGFMGAFLTGRLSAPVRVRDVPGVKEKIYQLSEMPRNVLEAYLSVGGEEIVKKDAAQTVRSERHSYWQDGYIEGFRAGMRQR